MSVNHQIIKLLYAACLLGWWCWPALAKDHDERAFMLPASLVNQVESWVERADFWRLVSRAEALLDRVEIHETKSQRPTAWLCGVNTICITAGLSATLTPEEIQAAIAHEIGHMIVPQPKDGHAQLWETQCDLLATALLRNAEPVRNMLFAMNGVCRNCSDTEHLAPHERIALLDHYAALPLEKIKRFDALRAGSFALPLPDFRGIKLQ